MGFPHATYEDLELKLAEAGLKDDPLVSLAVGTVQEYCAGKRRRNGALVLEQHIYPIMIEIIDFYKSENRQVSRDTVAAGAVHDLLDDTMMNKKEFEQKFGTLLYVIIWPLIDSSYTDRRIGSISAKKARELATSREESRIVAFADRINNDSSMDFNFYVDEETGMPNPWMIARIENTTKYFLPLAAKTSPYFYVKMVGTLHRLYESYPSLKAEFLKLAYSSPSIAPVFYDITSGKPRKASRIIAGLFF